MVGDMQAIRQTRVKASHFVAGPCIFLEQSLLHCCGEGNRLMNTHPQRKAESDKIIALITQSNSIPVVLSELFTISQSHSCSGKVTWLVHMN